MSRINRAENILEGGQRFVREVKNLKRQNQELKAALQQVGADALNIIQVPSVGYLFGGPFNVPAGGSTNISVQFVPSSEVLTLWNFAATVYVDSSVAGFEWPSGTSLTSQQKLMQRSDWLDWADSSDVLNIRVFKVRITNNDVSAHDYYIKCRGYAPKTAIT